MACIEVTVAEFLRCANTDCFSHDEPVRTTDQAPRDCPWAKSGLHDWEDYPAIQFVRRAPSLVTLVG